MEIKNRNLFRLTRFVLLKLPIILGLKSKFRKSQRRILIIKLDAIGDYILFRNFIEELQKAEKYKGYSVDLLGNNLWKDLALNYDKQFIDDFIFIDPNSLYEKPGKMLKLGWKLFKNNYEIVLQPTYSRRLLYDGLAALTAAKKIIGFEGNTDEIFAKYKNKTDKFYTDRLLLPSEIFFEFDKTRFFFQHVTNSTIDLNKTTLPVTRNYSRNYVIIFPGAGVANRNWPLENFVAIAQLIVTRTNYDIMLAGAKCEFSYAASFNDKLPANRVVNKIGKTTLTEVVELIAGAQYVVCNESSALHISVACNTPAICILGGGHFNRFAPYPAYSINDIMFVYEKMACFNCNWNCILKVEKNEAYPCIAINEVEQAWEALAMLMSKQ